jgi:hypothetical protein
MLKNKFIISPGIGKANRWLLVLSLAEGSVFGAPRIFDVDSKALRLRSGTALRFAFGGTGSPSAELRDRPSIRLRRNRFAFGGTGSPSAELRDRPSIRLRRNRFAFGGTCAFQGPGNIRWLSPASHAELKPLGFLTLTQRPFDYAQGPGISFSNFQISKLSN